MRFLIPAIARHNEKHQAFILLAYNHGCRRGELLRLRGSDVSGDGFLRIERLKQRRNPIVNVQPLAENERALVQTGSKRLFPWSSSYASRIIKNYLKQAGVYTFAERKSLHSFATQRR
jgi:integrase